MEAVVTKRRGYITIGTEAWKLLGTPETPDAWHKALLLPDNYEVERAEDKGTFLQVFVLSETVPESDSHLSQVEVVPYYQTKDNQPSLVRIELREWNGSEWKTIEEK